MKTLIFGNAGCGTRALSGTCRHGRCMRWLPVSCRALPLAAALCLLLSAIRLDAGVVAAWNFNNYTGTDTPLPLSADYGLGLLSFDGFKDGASVSYMGTDLNVVNRDDAGKDLALVGQARNGDFLLLHLWGTGLSDFVLSYAARRSDSGFTTQTWAYSTDNIHFTDFAMVTPAVSWHVETVDFSSITGLDGQPDVYFRNILNGATYSSGNNRFDNLRVEAAAVPEPSAPLLKLGLMALLAGGLRFVGRLRLWVPRQS